MKTLAVLLSFLFFISCSTFEQNEPQMALTLTIPGGTVQLSGNPIKITTTASAVSGATNHKMLLRVTSTDGEIANGPWIDEKPGYSADFDIHGIVDGPFLSVFDTDHVEYINGWDVPVAEITVEVGESYVSSTGVYTVVWKGSPTAMKIIKGKLTNEELAVLGSKGETFYSQYITSTKFLNNQFNESVPQFYVADVSHNVKVWVYRITDIYVTLSCAVTFSDGVVDGKTFAVEPFSASLLYELNIDLLAANVCADNPTKTPVSYLVQFGSAVCNVNILPKYTEVHEEIIIKNRLSGIEIIHCYGKLEQSHQTNKETYTIYADPDQYKPTVISQSTGNQYKYKVNTGFKTEHERKWIADLLGSDNAWWKSERLLHLDGETFGMVPINIVPGSFRVVDTQEDLISMEFEFEVAHID